MNRAEVSRLGGIAAPAMRGAEVHVRKRPVKVVNADGEVVREVSLEHAQMSILARSAIEFDVPNVGRVITCPKCDRKYGRAKDAQGPNECPLCACLACAVCAKTLSRDARRLGTVHCKTCNARSRKKDRPRCACCDVELNEGSHRLGTKVCIECYLDSIRLKPVACEGCGVVLNKNAAYSGNKRCRRCANLAQRKPRAKCVVCGVALSGKADNPNAKYCKKHAQQGRPKQRRPRVNDGH